MRRACVFDLDGTLVDSAVGIAASLAEAFAASGLRMPQGELRRLIGPPVRVIARRLQPNLTEVEAATIETHYRRIYDGGGYRRTKLFAGVRETLEALKRNGHRLFVATNKPAKATAGMLEYLEVATLFDGVTTRDTVSPAFPGKSEMVAAVLARHDLRPKHALLMGDTPEDAEAARANQMPFVFASYGYGSLPTGEGGVASFADLLNHRLLQEVMVDA